MKPNTSESVMRNFGYNAKEFEEDRCYRSFSSVDRFREAGEEVNVNNVGVFGEPARSLFTRTRVMTLHHRIEICDGREEVIYRAETKFPSIHDKIDVFDAFGRHTAHIERKRFSLSTFTNRSIRKPWSRSL